MSELIDRQAAIEKFAMTAPQMSVIRIYEAVEILESMPTIQPEPSIPLSWIENEIEWLKSTDNEFAKLVVGYISIMLKKWRDEQDETD